MDFQVQSTPLKSQDGAQDQLPGLDSLISPVTIRPKCSVTFMPEDNIGPCSIRVNFIKSTGTKHIPRSIQQDGADMLAHTPSMLTSMETARLT